MRKTNRKKRMLSISAMVLALSVFFTGCDFWDNLFRKEDPSFPTVTEDESPEAPSESERESESESESETDPPREPEQEEIEAEFRKTNLPTLYLTGNLQEIIERGKSTEISGTYLLTGGEGNEEYAEKGNLTVKGRGNSSWNFPKKGFKLKLEKSTDLLGMGKSKHWAIIPNYTDGSYMRNALAYGLAESFGLLSMKGTWVDVVVNGKYYGNYYLCETVRVEKNRVNIKTIDDVAKELAKSFYEKNTDTIYHVHSLDSLENFFSVNLSWVSTGTFSFGPEKTFFISDYIDYTKEELLNRGVLYEVDSTMDEYANFHTNYLERPTMIHNPEYGHQNEELFANLKEIINAVDYGLATKTFRAVYRGQEVSIYDLINLDSVVAYWWIQEIFMNADGFCRSTYMYKAEEAGGVATKLNFGPVWDMDYSSGGMRDSGAPFPTDKWGCQYFIPYEMQKNTNWGKYFIQSEEFTTAAYRFYKIHRNEIGRMIEEIDVYRDYLSKSAEQDFARWGTKRGNFENETKILKDWLTQRLNWLDSVMVSEESFRASLK